MEYMHANYIESYSAYITTGYNLVAVSIRTDKRTTAYSFCTLVQNL